MIRGTLKKIHYFCVGILLLAATLPAYAQSRLVISQVYGGGGNPGSTYQNDFIELFNAGDTAQNLSAFTLQYTSPTGATWTSTFLKGTIQPGHYFLIQEAGGGGGTTPLPAPDFIDTVDISSTGGKIALVRDSSTLTEACPTDSITDFLGYGAANCYESSPAAAPGDASSLLRGGGACTDGNWNSTDFTAVVPTPRNSSSPTQTCITIGTFGPITALSLPEGNSGTTPFNFIVELNLPATTPVTFNASTQDGTAVAPLDYTAFSNVPYTIPVGQKTATVTVLVNGDTLVEKNESFTLAVSAITGASPVLPSLQAPGTIVNDDVANTNLTFSPASLPAITAGVPYSQVITVVNGDICTFSTSGRVPSGLSLGFTGLDNTATLSGIPSTSGTFSFTVSAGCADGSNLKNYSVNVANLSLTFSPSSLPAGTLGTPYSQMLTVTNGGTCTFAASGSVPPGLVLVSTGLDNTATLSGIPTSTGTFGFTVSAGCTNGSVVQGYSVNVADLSLSFSPTSLPVGTLLVPYSQVLTVTNGSACTFTTSGTVPPGLSLISTGLTNIATLSGSPSSVGTFGFTVAATCASGSVSQPYSVNVANANLSFSPSSVPAATVGVPFSQVLTVTNGLTCTFSTSGTIPPGLNLSSTGLTNTATLSGTPTSAGTFGFTVSAGCANGPASQVYSANVANAALSFSPSSLPAGNVGALYSQVLTVPNGGTCSFATSGTVPPGLSLSSTGLTNTATLSGTLTSAGTFGFTVNAGCANGPASQAYTVNIANATLSFSPSSLPAGTVGALYSQILTVPNGNTCTFTVSGTVPPNVGLGSSGQGNTATLSGTLTSAGTFGFTVNAACANGSASQAYTVNVANATLSFSPSSLPAGTAGTPYSQVLTVANGGACTFTTSGTVPTGLSLGSTGQTNTATLSGTPSPAGTFNFTVGASCANGPASQAYSVNIANANLSFSPSSLPAGTAGTPYSQVLTVANGGACTFTTSGTVPTGLSLGSTGLTNTATLSGTPSPAGTFNFTVGASCANGPASQAYSVNIANATLSFSPSSLPAGIAGTPYSQVLTVANGGACTFTTGGTVPTGLSLSATGLTNTATLSGTPSPAGTFNFTVSASCANGPASQAYSVNVANANLSFSPSSLPAGSAGTPYSQVLTVANGGACTFSTSGAVPTGLGLGSTGLTNTATLSGTPSPAGTFNFTVSASCANGPASQAYSVNIANANLSFSPSSLPAGTAGTSYSQVLTVANGGACTFTTSGTVPTGLSLGSTGLTNTATLSGTPSPAGTFGFTVSASCANGPASQAYSVNIANANLSFSPSSLPAGTAGTPYSQVLTVANGGACTFTTSGTVPKGLSLSASGLTNTATLSGTPSPAGTFNFTVGASCANGPASQAYSVNIANATLSFSPSSLPAGIAGTPYSQVLTVANGGACTFTTTGTVPTGLSLGPTGVTNTATLSGTPSPAGTFNFTVSASCANGPASQAYSVNIANASLSFSPSSLPAGTAGTPYSQVLTVANGGACTFTTGGTVPTGLGLSATGLTNTATLSGTPSPAGTFNFTVSANCANGPASQAYSVNIANASLSFSPSSLPAGTAGTLYSQVLTVANGGACTFTTTGTVPNGLSLGSTGLTNTATLSGTPSPSGKFNFTVSANCANGPASQAYSVNIANASLSFSPSSLPAGTAGTPYSQVLTVANGGACTFTTSGTVPTGLSLGSTGLTNTATLSGTPSPAGTFGFTVNATCANGPASQAYSVNIANANLSFSPSSLPAGTAGTPYSQVLTVPNGGACTFTTSGTVPTGLSLGSTGLTNTATLSGTPSPAGTFNFTVGATCANGPASQAYSVNIANANLSFSPSSLPAGTAGTPYSQVLTVPNGGVCTFTTSGTVPTGLSLGSTGQTNTATLSGTPSPAGTFNFTVSASCANGPASQAYSVNIANANLSFSPSSLPAGTAGTAYSQVLTVPNGGACTFTTSGTVPTGLSLGSTGLTNTATLSGTPSPTGTFNFTVSATCANGPASQAYSVNIANATLSFSPSSLPAGTAGTPYSQVLTIPNAGACTFTTGGTVPTGLSLASTGLTNTATLSGTPSPAGTFNFTVSANCANGPASQAYSVNIANATLSFSPSSLPAGTAGTPYSQVVTVPNGGACTFTTSGTVPTGLSLASTGLTNTATLSGTPSPTGTFSFTVSASCANGPALQAYSVNIANATLSFSPSSLPAGTAGTTYSQVLSVPNGGSCTFTTSGTAPTGLSLSSTGSTNTATLSGTPSSAGTFGFTVSASCANGPASQTYSVNIINSNLSFSPSSLPASTLAVAYSQVITVTNGGTCKFATSGTVPPGLYLGYTGETNTATLAGKPSPVGTYNFTVNANCTNGPASQAYSVNVATPSLSFSPSSLPAGTAGTPYSQVLTVTNGDTCTFTTSGTIPTGLSLGSTGLTNTAALSGTPSSVGTFGFTVAATCGSGSASQAYSVNVTNPTLSLNPSSLPAGSEGAMYSQVLTVPNGNVCTFTTSGTVPPGLSLTSTGLDNTATLSGIPSLSGTFSFTVSANCTYGSASQTYSANVVFACESGVKTSTPIHAVQGSGTVSPLIGQTVEVEGIVVGDFQAATQLRGFYLQEPDATWDSDPLTSEGLFIFDNMVGVDVNVGDRVRVRGTITELPGAGRFLGTLGASSLTEIGPVAAKMVCSSGNPFTVTTITLPTANPGDLERYEGMAVQITQQLVVTGNVNLGVTGSIDLAPAQLSAPTGSKDQTTWPVTTNLNQRSLLGLDDGSILTGASLYPTLFPQGGLSDTNTLRDGALVNFNPSTNTNSPLIGVLDDRQAEYRIQPTAAVTFYNANPRPAIAPIVANMGGRFHAVSANVFNFFTTLGTRGAATQTEFNNQKTKIIDELSGMNADLYGLTEVQNFASGTANGGTYTNVALQSLVDGLNCKAAGLLPLCTNPPTGPYALIDTLSLGANNGTDAIRSAIIYNPSVLTPVGAPAAYYQNDSNRPTLAQTFKPVLGTKAGIQTFTFAVNHFRSRSTPCGGTSDDTYQGNCNGLRLSMAQNVTTWLGGNPTGDPMGSAHRILQVGNFNAFYGEDPIQFISTNGYTNLIAAILGPTAYSYNLGSQAGYLDHTMANAPMNLLVKNVAEWHNNADEPSSLEALNSAGKSAAAQVAYYGDDPYAASDHDPIVIGFNPLAGDLNDDGVVDAKDLALLMAAYNKPASSVDRRMDYDGDGTITPADYRIWGTLYQAYTAAN